MVPVSTIIWMQLNRWRKVQNRRDTGSTTACRKDFRESHAGAHTRTANISVSLNGRPSILSLTRPEVWSLRGRRTGEMLHLCSSRWDLPARRHRSPGSLHPAQGVASLPGSAESHHLDCVAPACWGRGANTNRRERWGKLHVCLSVQDRQNSLQSVFVRVEPDHWADRW